ncbi:hypothetical protein SAMN05216207_10894 [Pseudonocardia ammonioxydans]|uniref:Uncharacterized protein n=1 Tax=Pseudonocardia ammonioxydans TaxID=260086 RepID=A0A1I5I6C0_PSUAM|nr:hypothetical protein SAMN05216207_10894 [Pseudonocardia ammonioxydans]
MMRDTAAVGTGPRLTLFIEQPAAQLAVIASGLATLAGPVAGQVLWLLAAVAAVPAVVRGPRAEADDPDDGAQTAAGAASAYRWARFRHHWPDPAATDSEAVT